MKEQFEQRIYQYEQIIQEEKIRDHQIANRRLMVVILFLVSAYMIYQGSYLFGGVAVISVGMFIYYLRKHEVIHKQLEEAKGLKVINEAYVARLGEGWKQFEETGEVFLDKEHPYAYDLDLMGQRSLYQKINVAHTIYGKRQLAKTLLTSPYPLDEKRLIQKQEAIGELISSLDFCQKLERITSKCKESKETEQLIDYLNSRKKLFANEKLGHLMIASRTLIAGSILLGVVLAYDTFFLVAGVLAFINYLYLLFIVPKISLQKGILSTVLYDLMHYKEIMSFIQQTHFDSDYLKQYKEVLTADGLSGVAAMQELEKLSNKAHLAYQPIVAIPLNALWLWDLGIAIQFERWCDTYGKEMEKWLEAIGEFESLCSLAVLGHLEEGVFPKLVAGESKISITAMGHPLISGEHRIYNDAKLEGHIFVITGSNMSGKTTFLRTIGINMVLASVGAPILAKEMTFTAMNLYTSMKITDNLSEGVSTFYAELKRIKGMIEQVRTGEPMLFLIDEIFRGTNSKDRIIGAKSVVESMRGYHGIGGLTTHDLELCELADGKRIKNYHFTENYTENQIHFDYKLKEGMSTTTNAKYLMEMVGIDIKGYDHNKKE